MFMAGLMFEGNLISIMELAVGSATIGSVLRMEGIGTCRFVDLDESAIDEGDFHSKGGEETRLILQFIRPHACVVVHVQTHTHKLFL